MFSMKTVLLLALFLYAAAAAPAEDKPEAPEAVAVVNAPEEQMAAVPVPIQEEEEAPETRFNPCPNGWNHYGSRCFVVVKTPMSWNSAKEYCNGLGANLASVTNSGEYSFLQQLTAITGQSTAWLGGFYLEGYWTWTDEAGFYYTNWYSQSSSSSYPCIYLRTSYGWGNTACYVPNYFICTKRPSSC